MQSLQYSFSLIMLHVPCPWILDLLLMHIVCVYVYCMCNVKMCSHFWSVTSVVELIHLSPVSSNWCRVRKWCSLYKQAKELGPGKNERAYPWSLHEAKYGTYKGRKIYRAVHFDSRPPSLRHTSSDSHININCYIQNLQAIVKKRHTTWTMHVTNLTSSKIWRL